MGLFAEHWETAIGAVAIGVALAHVYLAVEYLVLPTLRLRAARRRGPAAVADLMYGERRRLSRLRNTAAVYEEHEDPDAAALREEAELRALIAALLLGRT